MRLPLVTCLLAITLITSSCRYIEPEGNIDILEVAESTGLTSRIADADFVLLGEKHDNPEHHKIQAEVLNKFLQKDDLVVFEMINKEQQPVIDNFLAGKTDLATLEKDLKWEKSGWPDWLYYAPLFEAARDNGAQILYGSYPRSELMALAKRPQKDIPEFSDVTMAEIDQEMIASHCNMLPEHIIRPMSLIQIAKDDLLARQLEKKGIESTAYLIAGNGHVRKDRGVPYHLVNRNDVKTLVVGLIEDGQLPEEWELYQSYDAIWITESIGKSMEEYCEGLKAKFGKKKS